MTLAGRVLLLVLGLWLLAQTAIVPLFVSPQVGELRLRSERVDAPRRLPAMQAALLVFDLDHRTHNGWQVTTSGMLTVVVWLSLLFCGVIAVNAATQWLRYAIDSYGHVRHFGLTITGWAGALSLLLVQLVAHSADSGIRYLGLGVCGWITLVAFIVISLIHTRLEPQA